MTIKSVVKKLLDWAIFLLWFAAGCLVFIFAANIQGPAIGIALLVLMAVGPMAACLIALRNRRRATQIFLINGVFATGFLIFLDLHKFADRNNLWSSIFTTCGFAAAFFVVPSVYWLLTARWQWPPYLQGSFSLWAKLAFGMIGLLFLLAGSCWSGLSQIPWGDCSPRFFVAPRYPGHNAYTAKIIYAHHSSSYTHSGWSLARTEHKYWGIFGWNQTYTILPYIATNVGDEYLVEGRVRQSLIGYFLNIMETKCSLTWPISASALELHLLQAGPSGGDGIRIIGRVLKEDHAGKQEPVSNTSIALVPDHGPEIVQVTDAQGIFDFQKTPAGKYDIRLRTQPVPIMIREYGQCSGLFTSKNIADCMVIIREPAVPQQK